MSEDNDFASELTQDELLSILQACPRWVDPLSSIQAEAYFSALVREVEIGDIELAAVRMRERILRDFKYISGPPEWIQGAEWLFSGSGRPMIFIGSLDVPSGVISHDSCRFYQFYDSESGDKRSVIQVA